MRTRTGFEFEIAEEVLDDMELVDALCEAEENPLRFSKVVAILFGDRKKELYEHIKKVKGVDRVPVQAITDEVEDIFGALTAKN